MDLTAEPRCDDIQIQFFSFHPAGDLQPILQAIEAWQKTIGTGYVSAFAY
jgi:hypothetical protein